MAENNEVSKPRIQRFTPTGLPMEEPDETDNDLRKRIQAEQAEQKPAEKVPSYKSFVDQTEGMREANKRARIRSRR